MTRRKARPWRTINADRWDFARSLASNRGIVYASAGVLALTIMLALVGAKARSDVDLKLGQTFSGDVSFWMRFSVWKNSFAMIRDFPLFGVGLGSWAEILPHYQSPPWSSYFYFAHAHNDYIELIAETGLIGFALVVWLCSRGIKILGCRRG